MKITKIEISNFRNLDGIKVFLDDECNFIVGENNLGKSNLLAILNTIFNYKSFQYDDFTNLDLPIDIRFQIHLAEVEIGHFQDLFTIDDYSTINISAIQENPDEAIVFRHVDTDILIKSSIIKCLNYVHYDSLRNPVNEVNFDKGRGVGRFLRSIISLFLEENALSNSDFINDANVRVLLNAINDKISKIKSFDDYKITAHSEDNLESLLSKIIVLKDIKGISLLKSGYGVQFLILITLSILDKLQNIRTQRGDKGIFGSEQEGNKTISLVLGLDEPEIHLHPYMQRSLIKYLNSIINNTNQKFRLLVKELFDIDNFCGQIIVVTHSPNILLDNYKQIMRFHSSNGITKVISGKSIALSEQLNKHLLLHFPFIKEAFFSRAAIFVEGDSEVSSFPAFGIRMGIDFDELGICVIQAGGDSVKQLIELANNFGIPSIGINDRDDGSKPSTLQNHYKTNLWDFEAEIVLPLIDAGKESILRAILLEYDSHGINRTMQAEAINKRTHNLKADSFTTSIRLSDINPADIVSFKAFYWTWFSINKSNPLGLLIGRYLPEIDIPEIYKTVILHTKALSENV